VVHQHQVRLERARGLADLGGLAGADVVAGVGILDAGADPAEDVGAGGLGQLGEFVGAPRRIAVPAGMGQDQERALAFLFSIEQG
jgi:hypothetical protein